MSRDDVDGFEFLGIEEEYVSSGWHYVVSAVIGTWRGVRWLRERGWSGFLRERVGKVAVLG